MFSGQRNDDFQTEFPVTLRGNKQEEMIEFEGKK